MSFLDNRKFLSERVAGKIIKKKDERVEFKLSKDDNPVPIVDKIAIHSTYFPLKDGDKLNFDNDNNSSLCIAFGLGGGYHLLNYYNKSNEIVVIVFEYDILYDILENIDLSKFYDQTKLKIIDIDDLINYFNFFKYDSYFIVVHPVLQNLYTNEIKSLTEKIKQNFNPILLDIKTQKNFGKIWQNNIFKNFKRLFNNEYSFEPLEIDKPILIVGAGPSLEQNIEVIKKNIDNFFVVSSDTSLKILLTHKITPDLVFSFDAQNYSYLHFMDSSKNFRLFVDFTSPLKLKKIDTTPLFSNHPFFNLFSLLNYEPVKINSDTRNIGEAMVDFFLTNFANLPIITVGIDYSFYKYRSYSNGSYLADYKIINATFLNSCEQIDASFFYKNHFIDIADNWKTTSLMKEYSKNMASGIYSLSLSPFIIAKKIDNLNFLKDIKITKSKIDFVKPNFTKIELINAIKKYISKSYDIFLPYFLKIKKEPSLKEIEKFLIKQKII